MKQFFLLLILGCLIFITTPSKSCEHNSKCEEAMKIAAQLGMKYANTNIGYKKMIEADYNVTKFCGPIKYINKGE